MNAWDKPRSIRKPQIKSINGKAQICAVCHPSPTIETAVTVMIVEGIYPDQFLIEHGSSPQIWDFDGNNARVIIAWKSKLHGLDRHYALRLAQTLTTHANEYQLSTGE